MKLKVIEFITKSYKKMLEKMGEEGEIRAENVMELLTVANKYDEMISPPARGGDTEGTRGRFSFGS